jgi:hypothetical protein
MFWLTLFFLLVSTLVPTQPLATSPDKNSDGKKAGQQTIVPIGPSTRPRCNCYTEL